jgi:hypothetical protein
MGQRDENHRQTQQQQINAMAINQTEGTTQHADKQR